MHPGTFAPDALAHVASAPVGFAPAALALRAPLSGLDRPRPSLREAAHAGSSKRVLGLPSWIRKMSKTMVPIKGMSPIQYHHPLRSVSCKRRTRTDRPGKTTASAKRSQIHRAKTAAAQHPRTVKSWNHQYSEREARPAHTTYLEKQMLIDWPKVTPGATPAVDPTES